MTDLSMTTLAPSLPRSARAFGLFELVALWKQRRTLAAMDADQLADLGISYADAQEEAARPAWDVPAHWRS